MQQAQVQVPAGLGPGGAFQISNPMVPGQIVQVVVPTGLKPGDSFTVTLPAAPAGPPGGGRAHQVLTQMQGVLTAVAIPAGTKPGDKFMATTPNGKTAQVTCPEGCAPGQQIQFMDAPMEGVPTAPRPPDDAAVTQYEQLLAAVTRVSIRDLRKHAGPTNEIAALHLSGKTASGRTGELGTLYLVINGDPAAVTDSATVVHGEAASTTDYAGSAELLLSDGRVVMQLANPAWRAAQFAAEMAPLTRANKEYIHPHVQMMDREDMVRVTDETDFGSKVCCTSLCAPLHNLPKTHISHPLNTDETLKQGYQQIAPASLNFKTIVLGKLWFATVFPFFCIPTFLAMSQAPPDIHYQLQELRTGNPVDGVLYREKGRRLVLFGAIREHGRGASIGDGKGGLCTRQRIPDGDTLDFTESVPLQVRKDMLAVLVYRLTFNSLGPFVEEDKDAEKAAEYTGG